MAILSGGDDAETWNKHRVDRLRIEQDEPPIFRALDSLCYNEVAKAEGSTHFVPVTRAQRFTRHFWRWGGLEARSAQATQNEKPASLILKHRSLQSGIYSSQGLSWPWRSVF